jgi:hypothetical protein
MFILYVDSITLLSGHYALRTWWEPLGNSIGTIENSLFQTQMENIGLFWEHVGPLHWQHENYGCRHFQSRLIDLPNSMGMYFNRCSYYCEPAKLRSKTKRLITKNKQLIEKWVCSLWQVNISNKKLLSWMQALLWEFYGTSLVYLCPSCKPNVCAQILHLIELSVKSPSLHPVFELAFTPYMLF